MRIEVTIEISWRRKETLVIFLTLDTFSLNKSIHVFRVSDSLLLSLLRTLPTLRGATGSWILIPVGLLGGVFRVRISNSNGNQQRRLQQSTTTSPLLFPSPPPHSSNRPTEDFHGISDLRQKASLLSCFSIHESKPTGDYSPRPTYANTIHDGYNHRVVVVGREAFFLHAMDDQSETKKCPENH
ncbi:hypothetical protein ACLOJK_011359 [Asimina triloba]